ncbi:lactate utilization protein [bacterium]|nr:lactate utilization protein [candidate division CSSED10-310 bacterium]
MSDRQIDAIKKKYRESFNEILARKVIEKLRQRNISGYWAPTRETAREMTLEMIPDGAVVSQGGSVTLDETGIREALMQSTRLKYVDPYAEGLSPEDKIRLRRESLLADVFICSANAITLDGILVNRDGIGNRVAAMAFGPGKVIIVSGMNKIVVDVDGAFERIDSLAAPMNCIRLNRATPCRESLECTDCDSADRICSVTTIIDWQWTKDRMHVILVNDNLGF